MRKILDKDEQIDYAMSGKTAAHIEMWSALYKDKAPWLDSNIQSAGIAAAVAGEIARLTVLEVKSEVSGSAKASYIDEIYQKVIEKLRIQVEYADAKGSLIFKPYVTSNGISIQYIQGDNFFPLKFDTETITKCAFLDQFRRDNEIYSRIEIHTLKDGLLNIRNRAFVSRTEGLIGNEISVNSVPKWSELAQEMTFSGIDKLPFGYFKVPLGNNQDSKVRLELLYFQGLWNTFGEADRRYSQINWEYESKETAVHIAQSLLGRNQSTGEPVYPAGKKRLYRAVEYNTGVVDKPFMDTFSPDIRDTSYFNGWNHLMRMIEFDCNLAYGTISDPNNTDKTAEEIKASKQRSYSSCKAARLHCSMHLKIWWMQSRSGVICIIYAHLELIRHLLTGTIPL
ncbi:MAG: hypothetical protein ACLTER_00240 [Ruminococcus sp.]